MSYVINWYAEKQVINLRLFGHVTSPEVIQLNRKTVDFVRTGIEPVHIILDTLDVESYPVNLRWVLELMQSNHASPQGWNIIVSKNKAIRLLGVTILNILSVPVHTCETLDDAYIFLADLQIAPFAGTA